jgi:hypothetical protein
MTAKSVASFVVGVIVCAALAGCGGDDPALTDAASNRLQQKVSQARTAFAEGDPDAANARLDETLLELQVLEQDDQVEAARAADIRAAIADVRSAMAAETTTTTSSSTTAPTTTTTLPPETEPPTTATTTSTTTTSTTTTTTTTVPDGGGDGDGDGDGDGGE